MIKEIIDANQSFECDISPQGFFLLPNASRQCADTPIAKKYSKQTDTSLSKLNSTESAPHMVKDMTIPV